MKLLQRLLNVLALILGFLGVLMCLFLAISVFNGSLRLRHTTHSLFKEMTKPAKTRDANRRQFVKGANL